MDTFTRETNFILFIYLFFFGCYNVTIYFNYPFLNNKTGLQVGE